ncbi:MAG: maleylpyruvate isomerase family mycothiol-dependent enzyme [Acidimicrobiales bacterium]
MAKVWELAGKARTDFADMVAGLSDEQMQAETLCTNWTPHHVLGHLTGFVDVGLPAFFFNIAKNGFNFDKASMAAATKMTQRSREDLLTTLRAKATKSSTVPTFPEELTVADVAVHTQDVRRPLGLEGQLDDAVLRSALAFVAEHKMSKLLTGRDPQAVKIVATDLDLTIGDGPVIEGAGEAILLAMVNRPTHDELTGDGVDLFR